MNMEKKKEPSPLAIVWGWADKYHGKLYASVALAVLGVAGTMLLYVCIAAMIRILLEQGSLGQCLPWCAWMLAGYLIKSLCSTWSTAISHTATYYTLRDMRKILLAKLSRVPMGTILDTPSGQYKTTIVDRVEGMEPTLAHLIPEMTANVLAPVAIAVYIFILDWRMGIASLVTTIVGFGVAIAVCALVFYFGGSMTLSNCILLLIASFMVYQQLENAGNMSDNLQMLGESMRTANAIDETPVMDIEGKEITPKDASIDLENVTFAYQDRKILLGGYDVKEYKLDNLMKNISMVFQNVYLFNDTIENNIRFGKPDATHEQVVAAAKAACCHDFIEALPDGYDTVLGEGGGTLSGGEKQRISIARAMLKDAPIVILDEATASVDPENEEELQKAIDALTHNKTIIMIAHRLKTVRSADQILVLNGGKITQRGTHETLAKQPGLYADFLKAREAAAGWKLA